MKYPRSGIRHFLILAVIFALTGVGSLQAGSPGCGPDCLHCKSEMVTSCCPEPVPAPPCHDDGTAEVGIDAVGCSMFKDCSLSDSDLDCLVSSKVLPDQNDSLALLSMFSRQPAGEYAVQLPCSARPPPPHNSPFYILNCSLLN